MSIQHVVSIELVKKIREERKRAWLSGDFLGDHLIERNIGRAMHFEADACGLRRPADHLAQLGGPGRQEFEPPVAFRQMYQLRRLVGTMPEVLSHRGDDPDQTRAHETVQKLDEQSALADRYAFIGKQLLELIDHQDQLGGFILQHAA